MKSSDGINILVQIYLLVNMYTHFWRLHTYKWDCWVIGCIYVHILPNNMFSKVDTLTYISPSTGWEFLLFLNCIKTWKYQSFTFWCIMVDMYCYFLVVIIVVVSFPLPVFLFPTLYIFPWLIPISYSSNNSNPIQYIYSLHGEFLTILQTIPCFGFCFFPNT